MVCLVLSAHVAVSDNWDVFRDAAEGEETHKFVRVILILGGVISRQSFYMWPPIHLHLHSSHCNSLNFLFKEYSKLHKEYMVLYEEILESTDDMF
jgi:hypothetical protein